VTTQEAVDFFGSRQKLAEALGIWVSATYQWGDHPPPVRQFQIEVASKGKLKAERIGNEQA
jgi:hypothetical protein